MGQASVIRELQNRRDTLIEQLFSLDSTVSGAIVRGEQMREELKLVNRKIAELQRLHDHEVMDEDEHMREDMLRQVKIG